MIALSLIGLLLMEGIYEGMAVQMTQNSIKTGSGTLSIQHPEFRSDEDLHHLITDPETVMRQVLDTAGVSSACMRLKQPGLIANAGYSQSVTVMGVDLDEEQRQNGLQGYLSDGEYTLLKRRNGAIIGYRLAARLKTSVGKKVIVTLQDRDNEIVSAALTITAVVRTNNMAIDSHGLLMDRTRLQSLTGVNGASEIAVMLDDQDQDAPVKALLSQKIADDSVTVYSYNELFPTLHESEVMMENYNKISSAFIFIIAALGIFGVVLVSVLERIREFGIMLAIGTPFWALVRTVVYESLFITLGGYLAGALIGGTLLWYFNRFGLDLSGWSDAFAIFGMDANIYAIIKSRYFTDALISVVVATLVAVILPVRTLWRNNPIQSINKQVR
jgi:ABC-type lipoprotein release transport system permease subunit